MWLVTNNYGHFVYNFYSMTLLYWWHKNSIVNLSTNHKHTFSLILFRRKQIEKWPVRILPWLRTSWLFRPTCILVFRWAISLFVLFQMDHEYILLLFSRNYVCHCWKKVKNVFLLIEGEWWRVEIASNLKSWLLQS